MPKRSSTGPKGPAMTARYSKILPSFCPALHLRRICSTAPYFVCSLSFGNVPARISGPEIFRKFKDRYEKHSPAEAVFLILRPALACLLRVSDVTKYNRI